MIKHKPLLFGAKTMTIDKTPTPRTDHYRAEFKRLKEQPSELVSWLLDEFAQEEQRLAAAQEAERKDAERYRYLKAHGGYFDPLLQKLVTFHNNHWDYDAAIDAAMKETGKFNLTKGDSK